MPSSLLRRSVAAVAVIGAVAAATAFRADAHHKPANKVAASGATATVATPDTEVVLLSEQVRTSNPADLLLSVTAECVITTEVTTTGNELQKAEGTVEVWIEIDGTAVPVAPGDNGEVTFCNRFYERQTTLFDDEDATIRTLDRVGAANGFNWVAINVGAGVHNIVVKARLTVSEKTAKSEAMAAVGKRTLVIEPTHASNDESLTNLNT